MRRAFTLALGVVMSLGITSTAAIGAAPTGDEFGGGRAFLPSLDDPVSAIAPRSSYQSVAAAVQTLGTRLGSIRVPAIDLDAPLLAGVDLSVIDEGPAHWVGTAGPGEAGNMVIAGHRTTHGAPFNRLDELQVGDVLYFETPSGVEAMYSVSETLVVEPHEIWITYDTPDPMVTLFACHPKGSAAYRIVVRAKLIGEGRIT